jgi:hypothetical protein
LPLGSTAECTAVFGQVITDDHCPIVAADCALADGASAKEHNKSPQTTAARPVFPPKGLPTAFSACPKNRKFQLFTKSGSKPACLYKESSTMTTSCGKFFHLSTDRTEKFISRPHGTGQDYSAEDRPQNDDRARRRIKWMFILSDACNFPSPPSHRADEQPRFGRARPDNVSPSQQYL